MICQNIYWPGITDAVQKEVTNCDTCQHTKLSNITYGKLPVKETDKIPLNKVFVHLIRSYLVQWKKQKENLNLKAVTIIYHVTGWFEVTQYNDKKEMSIAKLVKTMWL